jgi:UDP-N-acetylmuramate dehydrogenase
VAAGVPLGPRTTLGLGGAAELYAVATSERDVHDALAFAEGADVGDVVVLGGGSNVVVADEGVAGLVLDVQTRGVRIAGSGEVVHVEAAAGEDWDALVARTVDEGLAGLECLSGIPGRVGATPIQNVGAYGVEVADTLVSVRVVDRATRRVRTLARTECAFGYRSSAFRRDLRRFVVLAVTFALRRDRLAAPARYPELARALGPGAARAPLAIVREAVLALRRAKSMLLDDAGDDRRSVGSFFTNPVVDADVAARLLTERPDLPHWPERPGDPTSRVKLAAGWLVEQAGFPRGLREGAVGLSSRHALALVHHGGGTTAALVGLARRIRDGVRARFGVTLEPEPIFLGFPPGFAL